MIVSSAREKDKFPLRLWQNTEEYATEHGKQRERLSEIYGRLRQRGVTCLLLGDLRFNEDGLPEAFLTDSMPSYIKYGCLDQKTAQENAVRYGSRGWWHLDELEEFIAGTGLILEEAMWNLGYRKSRKNKSGWARKTICDLSSLGPYGQKRWNQRMEKSFTDVTLDAGEEARLEALIAGPNDEIILNETFSFTVGKQGMIFADLDLNPFGDVDDLAVALKRRCHIARQQEGFAIEAEKVMIKGKPMIHIRAIRTDGSRVETVWPVRVKQEKIHRMAEGFVKRVNQAN
jgi:hypothetical protein